MNIFFGGLVYLAEIRVNETENAMETYYFQINSEMQNWEKVKAFAAETNSKSEAYDHAQILANSNNCEVRVTDNKTLLQGTYFRPHGLGLQNSLTSILSEIIWSDWRKRNVTN